MSAFLDLAKLLALIQLNYIFTSPSIVNGIVVLIFSSNNKNNSNGGQERQ